MPAGAFMPLAGSTMLNKSRVWNQTKLDTLALQAGGWA